MLAKQYETDGKVSLPMVLVCAMQFLYVFDGLYFEVSVRELQKFINFISFFFVGGHTVDQ